MFKKSSLNLPTMSNPGDIASVAEMVYQDLIGNFGTDKLKLPLDGVLEEAKAATATLDAGITAAQVLSAMEKMGYLERFGRECTLIPPSAKLIGYH